jgi:hypothetical protein
VTDISGDQGMVITDARNLTWKETLMPNPDIVDGDSITIEQAADILDDIKADLLFDNTNSKELDATNFAVQHFLTAVSHIDIAIHQLRLARLFLSRENAGNF